MRCSYSRQTYARRSDNQDSPLLLLNLKRIIPSIELLCLKPRCSPFSEILPRDALIMPLIRPRANRQPQKVPSTIASENTEAEETQRALTRLVDMLATRQMIVKIETTKYDLVEMDKQIRLASEKGARGVVHVFDARNLEYDELTTWTKMLAEARLLLHEMKAESLLKALVCILERLIAAFVLFPKLFDVSYMSPFRETSLYKHCFPTVGMLTSIF